MRIKAALTQSWQSYYQDLSMYRIILQGEIIWYITLSNNGLGYYYCVVLCYR